MQKSGFKTILWTQLQTFSSSTEPQSQKFWSSQVTIIVIFKGLHCCRDKMLPLLPSLPPACWCSPRDLLGKAEEKMWSQNIPRAHLIPSENCHYGYMVISISVLLGRGRQSCSHRRFLLPPRWKLDAFQEEKGFLWPYCLQNARRFSK